MQLGDGEFVRVQVGARATQQLDVVDQAGVGRQKQRRLARVVAQMDGGAVQQKVPQNRDLGRRSREVLASR